jgi:hypothetical protein
VAALSEHFGRPLTAFSRHDDRVGLQKNEIQNQTKDGMQSWKSTKLLDSWLGCIIQNHSNPKME